MRDVPGRGQQPQVSGSGAGRQPTQGGGYVNFLPKSPYYDKFRGSVRTTIGSYDYFNTQVDIGGPFDDLATMIDAKAKITYVRDQGGGESDYAMAPLILQPL